MGKSPLLSKTLWVNLLAVIAMLVQGQTGFVLDPEAQIAILGVINLVLRIVTKEPLDWTAVKGPSGQSGRIRWDLPIALAAIGLAVVLALPLLSGCSAMFGPTADDPTLNAGKSLIATHDTIENLHESFRAPCEKEIVPASACDEVHRLALEAGPTYDAASAAEILALQSGNLQDEEQYKRWGKELAELSAKLRDLAIKHAVGQEE